MKKDDTILKLQASKFLKGGKEAVFCGLILRLTRNLAPYGFAQEVAKRQKDLCEVLESFFKKALPQASFYKVEELSNLEKDFWKTCPEIDFNVFQKAHAVLGYEASVPMVICLNGDNHIEIQVFADNFVGSKLWKILKNLDDAMGTNFPIAFDNEIGFLCRDIHETGTGLKVTSLLHLPALTFTDKIQKYTRALTEMGMQLKKLHGNDASDCLYSLSNFEGFSNSEVKFIERNKTMMCRLVEKEKMARSFLQKNNSRDLYDNIGRAFSVLRNSYQLSLNEARSLISLLLLGLDLQMFPQKYRPVLFSLMQAIQKGNLSYIFGEKFISKEEDVLRSELLRDQLRRFPEPTFPEAIKEGMYV